MVFKAVVAFMMGVWWWVSWPGSRSLAISLDFRFVTQEIERDGIRFPTDLDTPYAVAQILNQQPGKLRIKDIRDAVVAKNNSRDQTKMTRQMKVHISFNFFQKNSFVFLAGKNPWNPWNNTQKYTLHVLWRIGMLQTLNWNNTFTNAHVLSGSNVWSSC